MDMDGETRMRSRETSEPGSSETGAWRLAPAAALVAAAVLVLIGAGGLLWARQGGAVFTDLMTAALAWCF
jgi:hypothetical protein